MALEIHAPGPADGAHVYGPHTIDFANGVAEVDGLHPGVRSYMEAAGYRVGAPGSFDTEDEGEQGGDPDLFDPSAHKVEAVLEHLADADDEEAARVLSAEAEGKARPSILKAKDEEANENGD